MWTVYIGQTGCKVSEHISEHDRDLRMQYFDKLAVAQHALESNITSVSTRPDLFTERQTTEIVLGERL